MRDEEMIRGNIPMSKMEVRATSLSYLDLYEAKNILDVGAGTGSVCIEALRRHEKLSAVAIEREPEGAMLIEKNAEKFGVFSRLEVITQEAPTTQMPKGVAFDRVFIGGSGRQLSNILKWLKESYLDKEGIVVVNAIAIESLTDTVATLKELGFSEIEGSMIQPSRLDKLGSYHYFKPLNPCYVIKACWHL